MMSSTLYPHRSASNVIELPIVKMRRLTSYFVWGLVVLTWCIAMLGAYVRLSDAGLGCPDWPGCYGYWKVPEKTDPVFAVHPIWSKALLESGKAWKEMVHRYAVSILGIGILALIISLEVFARRFKQRWIHPTWSIVLIGWLVLQALFGMWTVTLKLMPIIVTGHLMGGMLLFVWLTRIATLLSYSGTPKPAFIKPRWAIQLVWLFVLMQIILGGWVSSHYAAGACGNSFPLCRGQWIPDHMNWPAALTLWDTSGLSATEIHVPVTALIAIHWMHRIGAFIVTCALIGLSLYARSTNQPKYWRMLISHALAVQLFLGFANIFWNLPLWSAVLHNGGAALLLGVLTVVL
jgi:heme a synthase